MTDKEKIKWLKFAVLELAQEVEMLKHHIPADTGKDIHIRIHELVKDF